MKRIVVATQNQGKVKEIKEMLKDLMVDVKTMGEVGIEVDIEENGTTFKENAKIKAEAISSLVEDAIVIADDSGLEIDCLNKAPGVYSARYLGKDTPYEIKNQMILDQIKDIPKEERTARFVCAIALSQKSRETIVTEGIMEGYIGYEAQGLNGFGYDPIFFTEEFGTSNAVLSMEQKNQISHRSRALKQMKEKLRELL